MKTPGRAEDHQPPPVLVGRRPGVGGAEDGADRNRGDDQSLFEAAQAEVVLDEEQSPGDDAGVVAEEEPAETGDGRGQNYVAARPSPRRLKLVAHSGATVYRPADGPDGRRRTVKSPPICGFCGFVSAPPLALRGAAA